ncbi:hypothetical protein L202_08443 [Cryptococcus amylolentus CBS 6039]|uniref:JmjC domain-containing histone demethylation protein 1 n=1 Tax=Cryptococcus amylolentus CBS 6039 TaxID=1295533 RepID=A0A1E3H9N1_9TREE|nr:hypothetical protein L202_08443 [Cryptococcus amylolentus CBS 6039]ODN73048.1 hypothetical protein L202_08443 [Cryptococcus amylolentus CBS 6039]
MSDPDPSKTPPETCPLCPPSGPPQPPPPAADDLSASPSAEVDLVWIACNKCDAWYHSACLFLSGGQWMETVPSRVKEEVGVFGERGPWANWVDWIGKWYCAPCISKSTDPSNPRPPRNALHATLKRSGIQPKDVELASRPLKRAASLHDIKPLTKKARTSTSTSVGGKAESISTRATRTPETVISGVHGGSEVTGAGEAVGQGRPKRKAAQVTDYNNLHNSIATPTAKWLQIIANPEEYGRTILDADYPTLPGHLLTKEWLESLPPPTPQNPIPQAPPNIPSPSIFHGPDRTPLIIRPSDGGFSSLGGHLPSSITVRDIARLVGPEKLVDVIDVASQQSASWPLEAWAEYLAPPETEEGVKEREKERRKVYNIISLEISDTELAKLVKPPRIVREIDWVDNFWDFGLGKKAKGKGKAKAQAQAVKVEDGDGMGREEEDDIANAKRNSTVDYPKVQLYCLMGMKGAWTDWHVDFAASSVYYTIHSGAKVFFFIKPTEANLKAYAKWSGSYEEQSNTWLGDWVDHVYRVELRAGDTMIIPTGYIHAVYTPVDTIVFGGNFLHSYNLDTQLQLRQIEIDTKVPQRFRFPNFDRLCWYVAIKHLNLFRSLHPLRPPTSSSSSSPSTPPPKVPHHTILQNLLHLTSFLNLQIKKLRDDGPGGVTEKTRKAIWDRIPPEFRMGGEAGMAEGLVRELGWRVADELDALGLGSGGFAPRITGSVTPRVEIRDDKSKKKEKEKKSNRVAKVFDHEPASRTWHFDPPPWQESTSIPHTETRLVPLPLPTPLPLPSSANGNAAKTYYDPTPYLAEQTSSVVAQSRVRVRQMEGGVVVEEKQATEFREWKTVWGRGGAGGMGNGGGMGGGAGSGSGITGPQGVWGWGGHGAGGHAGHAGHPGHPGHLGR